MTKKTFRPQRQASTDPCYPVWDGRSRRDFLLALGAATGALVLGCSDEGEHLSGKPDTPPSPKDQGVPDHGESGTGGIADQPKTLADMGMERSPDVYIKDLGGAVDAPRLTKDLK